MDRMGAEDVPRDGFRQRGQQCGRPSDPARHRGPVQVDPLAGVELALAVKREVIGIFADEDMGEQAWARSAALDGP